MNLLVNSITRSVIFSTVFLASVITFAADQLSSAPPCPNLSGTFVCKDDKGSTTLIVSQEVVNGQTIYTMSEDGDPTQSPTDNYLYPYTDVQNNVTGTARFTCVGNAFVSTLTGQKSDDKQNVIAKWQTVRNMNLTAHGDLQISTTGTITAQGQTTPIQEPPAVCSRQ